MYITLAPALFKPFIKALQREGELNLPSLPTQIRLLEALTVSLAKQKPIL
jgi:hypothetical protein